MASPEEKGRLVATKANRPKKGKLQRVVDAVTDPLIDLPDAPGALGSVQRAAESITSPVGLIGTILSPVGGGSFATQVARSAIAGVGANIVGEGTARLASRYEGPAKGLVQIGTPLVAAGITGRKIGYGLGATRPISRLAELEAEDLVRDPTTLQGPIDKMAYLIRNAKPAAIENQILRAPERSRRAGIVAATLQRGNYTRESVAEAKRLVSGEMPVARFAAPGEFMSEMELIQVLQQVGKSNLRPWEQLGAEVAMLKVFDNGVMPTRGEARLLEQVYGEDFVASILKHQTKSEVFKELAFDFIGLPRAIRASMDVSAPLRQGALLVGRREQFVGALGPMLRSFGSEAKAAEYLDNIKADPYYAKALRHGLEITDLSKITGANTEEYFGAVPKLLKGTVLSQGIKASERAYTVFLDKLRFDSFKKVAQEWESIGKDSDENLSRIAEFYNYATGRGKLPAFIRESGASSVLSATMFAPKFLYSRVAAPGMFVKGTVDRVRQDPTLLANPAKLYGEDVVLKEMARNLGAFVAMGLGFTGAAVLGGKLLGKDISIESDPRSSDFGKGRVGDTRFDFWAGYQPLARYITQLVTGEAKTTGTKQIRDADRIQTASRLIRSKESPIVGFLHSFFTGENFIGEQIRGEVTDDALGYAKLVADSVAPLFLADVQDAVDKYGASGFLLGVPAAFGAGVQSYASTRDVQNQVARELFGKADYRDLNGPQQSAVNSDERVIRQEQKDEVRASDYRQSLDRTEQQRLDAENIAATSFMLNGNVKDFRDTIAEQQLRARVAKDTAAADFKVQFTPPGSRLQVALDEYYDLFRQADRGYDPTDPNSGKSGIIDWDKFNELERNYLRGLSPEERDFVDKRKRAEHTNPIVKRLVEQKEYVSKVDYYGSLDKAFAKYKSRTGYSTLSDFQAALNLALLNGDKRTYERLHRVELLIDKESKHVKERMRKNDAKLEQALLDIGAITKVINPRVKRSTLLDYAPKV